MNALREEARKLRAARIETEIARNIAHTGLTKKRIFGSPSETGKALRMPSRRRIRFQ